MNRKLYPLKFTPIFLDKVWGSESWLISSMGEGLEGEVTDGFLSENTLSDILETYMGELTGDKVFEFCHLQFPVLLKRLEIKDRISVQVHPDDETALERYDDYGKEEIWYILKADKNARIYLGFNKDTDASEFYGSCCDGTVDGMLNEITPKAGELYHIKPGTVHSCRGGLTIIEIQQPSYQTLRLYDWGRENNPDTAREMDLEEALDIIDYSRYDVETNRISRIKAGASIFSNEHFTVSGQIVDKAETVDTEAAGGFIIYICVEGSASICDAAGAQFKIEKGESILIPSSAEGWELRPSGAKAVLMKVTMGEMEEKDDYIK